MATPVHSEPSRQQNPLLSRRWLWLMAVVVTGLFLCWFGGGLTRLMHYRVSQALSVRNYEQAEQLLRRIRQWGCDNPETSFWEARLQRKLLRLESVPELLSIAQAGGFDRERIRRELMLAQAQSGNVRPIVRQMNQLMLDPRGDGAEICEAYVNGGLIAGSKAIAELILPVWKQEFPKDPQPHYANARLLEYESQFAEAEVELRAAIEKDGRHWPSLYALGRVLLEQNRVEESLTLFEAAMHMRDNAAPAYQKARCLRSLTRLDEARAILIELTQRPADVIRASFARVGEPQQGLPIHLELGTIESTLLNHQQAVQMLDMVLNDDPKNLDARYARAIALRDLNQAQEADLDFAEVQRVRALLQEVDRLADEIGLAPNEPHLEKRCRIGELFILHESGRKGEFWLRDALNRAPNYAPAHLLLAEYYTELAKKEPRYMSLADEHRAAARAATGTSTVEF